MIEDLFARARRASEKDLGALAVELAELILKTSVAERSAREEKQRRRVGKLLRSEAAQKLGLLLTDRAYRSASPGRTVAAAREAARLTKASASLGPLDRAQLDALHLVGGLVPPVTTLALRARLHLESQAFIIDADALQEELVRLKSEGFRINLNQLGEEVLGEKDAGHYVERTIALLESAEADAISVKLSSLFSQVRVLAFDEVVRRVTSKLAPIFEAAEEHGRLIYFDMEAYRDLDLTRAIFLRTVLDPTFARVRAGIALQAYLPETLGALAEIADGAKNRVEQGGERLRVRLVKGANLAAETVQASLHRLEVPIFPSKHEVDAHMKRVLRAALQPDHTRFLQVGLGSHNIFDQAYAVLLAEQRGASDMLELEMLYGMSDSVGRAWTKLGRPVLVYAPLVSAASFPAAIAYLVRRLDENTSAENFLSQSLSMEAHDAAFEREAKRFLSALEASYTSAEPTRRRQDRSAPGALTVRGEGMSPFDNAADTDWTREVNRAALKRALAEVDAASFDVTARIKGQESGSQESFGFDPSRPGQRAYRIRLAGPPEIEQALTVAASTLPLWSKTPARIRALILDRAADELEKDRLKLIALMVKDAGKRVEEADIEVSEAVDFARYYARQVLELDERYEIRGRGVTVVTPPWNFPLAIPMGGCLAALAAGNPVILKPAPETPLVAQAGVEALYRAGVPTDALSFLPCDDSVASPLICDPRVAQVILTGATSTAQLFLKMRPELRLLAETGGKNAAFVSALSDREAAISAIVQSAFGHAGQKCSALSVLVLEEEVYEDAAFRRALGDAAASLPVGSAWDLESFVTPLIHPPSGPLRTVLSRGDGRARWALRPSISSENPALVSPGILWGVPEGGFAHTTEFFGPVLSVLSARDLDHGLALMNQTPYGLTAGFFGLSESEQERFVRGMHAGNLYINRGITGAVVGRQPFGGHKASNFGPGVKAGGPGYVQELALLTPKSQKTAPSPVRADGPRLPPEVPGTPVVGEANWLRYLPAEVVVVVGSDSKETDLKRTLSQAENVGAHAIVYRSPPPNESQNALDRTSTILRATRALESILKSAGTTRVRLVGGMPPELRRLVAPLGLSVLSDPVSEDPELEQRHYLVAQSISVAYHRYGNLSLGSLHPLLQGKKL